MLPALSVATPNRLAKPGVAALAPIASVCSTHDVCADALGTPTAFGRTAVAATSSSRLGMKTTDGRQRPSTVTLRLPSPLDDRERSADPLPAVAPLPARARGHRAGLLLTSTKVVALPSPAGRPC